MFAIGRTLKVRAARRTREGRRHPRGDSRSRLASVTLATTGMPLAPVCVKSVAGPSCSAEAMAADLGEQLSTELALPVRLHTSSGGLHRVQLGPIADHKEVQHLQRRLASMGYPDSFTVST